MRTHPATLLSGTILVMMGAIRPASAVDFSGAGALAIAGTSGCTAVSISATVVLSAAHCLSGVSAATVSFQGITASRIDIAPGFVSFGVPDFDNDLAAITLSTALPETVATYGLYLQPLTVGTEIQFVRQSGAVASNLVGFLGVDGPSANPGDFDTGITTFGFDDDTRAPAGSDGFIDGLPAVAGEAGVSSGDSGSPVFVIVDGVPLLAGINLFQFGATVDGVQIPAAGGGGLRLAEYQEFLSNYILVPEPQETAGLLVLAGIFARLRRR
jgi:hypothetical protein